MTDFRPTLPEDFATPPARTVRAVTVLEDERVLGIAGFYRDIDRLVMFVDVVDPQGWNAKRVVVKACRALLGAAAKTRLPVHAMADPAVEASERFLAHLGFRRLQGPIFQWVSRG